MQRADLDVQPSVKLFPRIAMPSTARKRRRAVRIVGRNPLPVMQSNDEGQDARTQVRARLLRMILDNEQARRNDQRPSAS